MRPGWYLEIWAPACLWIIHCQPLSTMITRTSMRGDFVSRSGSEWLFSLCRLLVVIILSFSSLLSTNLTTTIVYCFVNSFLFVVFLILNQHNLCCFVTFKRTSPNINWPLTIKSSHHQPRLRKEMAQVPKSTMERLLAGLQGPWWMGLRLGHTWYFHNTSPYSNHCIERMGPFN